MRRAFVVIMSVLAACGPTAVANQPTSTAASTPVPTIATLTPAASPSPTPSALAKLHIGEAVDLNGVRITLQTATESAPRTFAPTAKPGMSFVSIVLRYDNGLTGPIQLYWEPWQTVGADGVRRRPSIFSSRDDTLVAGSVVPSGGFLVGSLTFEVPPGELDLYYTNPTTSRVVIWSIR